MTEDQIKHMVDRFLGWKLPTDFRPDGGVQFDPDGAKKLDPRNLRYEPYGTNLLDARQAEVMVRHMAEGVPAPAENEIGAAEVQVGQFVYRRIEKLMEAKPGTIEAAELTYLADLVASVEEYGALGNEDCEPVNPRAALEPDWDQGHDPDADCLKVPR